MPVLRVSIMFFVTFVLAALGLLGLFIDPSTRIYVFIAKRMWAPLLMLIGGIRVTVEGKEHVDLKQTYLVSANHQSQIDIPLLFYALPTRLRFLAKRSLFYIPVFGWSLFLARFIPIDRSRGKKAIKAIEQAAKRIKRGPSLVVFPEGTRTSDGKIHQFKTGAFHMAISASVPVLPVAIIGTYEVVPKSRLGVVPGNVKVVIGEPIPTHQLSPKDRMRLCHDTQESVEALFKTG